VEGSCEHGIEPSGSIKCWEGLSSVSKYLEAAKLSSKITQFAVHHRIKIPLPLSISLHETYCLT
jgi:hypothetical protein